MSLSVACRGTSPPCDRRSSTSPCHTSHSPAPSTSTSPTPPPCTTHTSLMQMVMQRLTVHNSLTLTHSLTQTHPLTHSHSPTHSLTLTHSLTHTHPLTHTHSHSPTHIHSPIHPLTHPLTHSPAVYLSCDGSVEGRELFLTASSGEEQSLSRTTDSRARHVQCTCVCMYPIRGSSFFFGKVTALCVLCCLVLFFVWLCLLLSCFLFHLSNMYNKQNGMNKPDCGSYCIFPLQCSAGGPASQ